MTSCDQVSKDDLLFYFSEMDPELRNKVVPQFVCGLERHCVMEKDKPVQPVHKGWGAAKRTQQRIRRGSVSNHTINGGTKAQAKKKQILKLITG